LIEERGARGRQDFRQYCCAASGWLERAAFDMKQGAGQQRAVFHRLGVVVCHSEAFLVP